MDKDLQVLSEREKEALRLLLKGHDAKSIARDLRLSVHTVNERLRDARRKLGVSSSREAARLLGAAEGQDPDFLGDKQFRVASRAADPGINQQPDRRSDAGHPLAWLGGGMLIMSLIIAAVVLASLLQKDGATDAQRPQLRTIATATTSSQSAGVSAAREWVVLVDRQNWVESWRTAGAMFKSQLSAQQWASTVQPVRTPLGAVSTRVLQSATRSSSLAGAPAGEYEIVQFQTGFAQKSNAIETVILVHEGADWKVAGYFIK